MKRHRFRILVFICFLLLLSFGGIAFWLFAGLPSVENISARLVEPSIRIVDRNGRLLYEMLPQDSGRNLPVPLTSIPLALQQATISTEDASFYENPGVDLGGILRAVWINIRGGEAISGGSTITQQVARDLLMTPEERAERSLRRKLRESLLAWQLGRRYSKDQILELYLNQTYYGAFSNGVEAAAQTFFNKHVADLDLAECALIAGLPQAPGLYNPFVDPEAASKRQAVVLGLMEKRHLITPEQARQAKEEILVYSSAPFPIQAPHFVMMVESELDTLLPPEKRSFGSQGLTVRTSLDLDMQHAAEAAISRQLDLLNHPSDGSAGHNVHNAALVALDPQTGDILALVGSPDYFDASISGAVNMAIAPAQPGSALKPVIYAAAMDPHRPQPSTAATVLLDVRTAFTTHSGEPYVPANYDSKEHGPVLARQALASSLNIPAVLTLQNVGLESAIGLASRLGITTLDDPSKYDLSLALGGGAVRLLELTSAYAAFDNGGYRLEPVSILEISDSQGHVIYRPNPPVKEQVLDSRVAWLITDMLSDDSARAIGFGLNSALRLDRPAAAKTGTTTNYHDNWTIGYTPDLVAGVWVGNADYQAMREVTGITGAGPIWHQFMRSALSGKPELDFPPPPGLNHIEVCALSGKLPTPACPYKRWEWFIPGTEPHQYDSYYQQVMVDAATGKQADANTPAGQRVSRIVLDLPPEARPWAHSQGLALLSDLLSGQVTSTSVAESLPSAPLSLVSPDPNATYRIDPSMPASGQKLHLEAVGETGLQAVAIFVDGAQIDRLDEAPYEVWWSLQAGKHQAWATAVRANGEKVKSEVVSFTVR